MVSGETRTSGKLPSEPVRDHGDERADGDELRQVQRRERGHGVLRAEEEQRREREDAPEAPVRLLDRRQVGRRGVWQACPPPAA